MTLQNPGHEPTVAAEQFCYLAVPAPRLEAVAPKQVAAAGGSTLTLIGHDFIAHCSVAINGQPVADVVFIDAETVEVMVPPGERGRYGDVSLTNADGQTSSCRRAFIYS